MTTKFKPDVDHGVKREPAPKKVLRTRPQQRPLDNDALRKDTIERFPLTLANLAK